MVKTMYDSVTAADIPADAVLVAGYVNGAYQWSADDWARFPNAQHVGISVYAWDDAGDVLDVEPGNATVAEAPGWIRMRQASGLAIPTIYCGESAIAAVRSACAGLTYDIWSAHYTGVPYITDGCVATQYANPTYSGGHYDLSQCVDWWPRAQECDWPWVEKKARVVAVAGELLTVADQIGAEATRKGGPRKAQVLALADEVRKRATEILA